jgi:hypothetical protein
MKKILILVSLVALVASGLFAQVTFTGKVQAASQHPADADGAYLFKTDHAAELQANIVADAANSAVIKFVELSQVGSDIPVKLDRAHFTTDYLKAFGLGMDTLVTITGNYGYNEFALASVGNVTSYDTTKKFGRAFTTWGIAQTIEVVKMVKLTGAFDIHNASLDKFLVDLVVTVPNVGPGTLKGEVAYNEQRTGTKYGEGNVNIEAAYEMTGLVTGLTVAPGVGFMMTLKEKTDDQLVGAAKVAYDTALFGAYINGGVRMVVVDADELKTNNVVYVPVALGASYSKMVGLDLGAIMDLSADDAKPTKIASTDKQGAFDSLDVSAWVMAGKGKFRLGYLFVPDKEYAIDKINAVSAGDAAKGEFARGIYFKATLEF